MMDLEVTSFFKSTIDDLNYEYYNNGASNKLKAVGDAAADLNGRGDFYDGYNGSSTVEFQYDANGNMTVNDNMGMIDPITYNHLNLPTSIYCSKQEIYGYEYTYDAVGNKLSLTMYHEFGDDEIKTDYVGNFIYEDGVLKRILHDNGVIEVLSNNNYEYQFFIKDHLGNTRVVCKPDFNSNGTLKDKPNELQRSDYYPFGMLHGGVDNQPLGVNENRYLYNGKEYQSRHWAEWTEEDDPSYFAALDWYDYGARFYDPQLGRWHSVDPLAEKYYDWSLYNYVSNNPLKFIDPTGMSQIKPPTQEEYELYGVSQQGQERFDKILRNIESLTENKDFMSAFMKTTGLSEEQAKEYFTYGKGPKVELTDGNWANATAYIETGSFNFGADIINHLGSIDAADLNALGDQSFGVAMVLSDDRTQ